MYPKKMATLGDHIRKVRLDRGMLQKDVAKALGVDITTVTSWEKGERTPRRATIAKIRVFLGFGESD